MGTISISLPIKANGRFRIKNRKAAEQLIKNLEEVGERVSAFDDVLGIWAGRPEGEAELVKGLRERNNRSDG